MLESHGKVLGFLFQKVVQRLYPEINNVIIFDFYNNTMVIVNINTFGFLTYVSKMRPFGHSLEP